MAVTNDLGLRLADFAASQWGLFTTPQARRLGLTRQQVARLAKTGAVERLSHGAYRIGGAPPDPRDLIRAAWLSLRPSQTAGERVAAAQGEIDVVSHRSAAWLRDLGDVEADALEFTCSVRRDSRNPDVRIHRRAVTVDEWAVLDGLPVTTTLTTIRDLAAVHLDGGHLATITRDALTTEHIDLDQVAQQLRPYARHYGAPLGDGHGLVRHFLELAGIPETTARLADLSRRLS